MPLKPLNADMTLCASWSRRVSAGTADFGCPLISSCSSLHWSSAACCWSCCTSSACSPRRYERNIPRRYERNSCGRAIQSEDSSETGHVCRPWSTLDTDSARLPADGGLLFSVDGDRENSFAMGCSKTDWDLDDCEHSSSVASFWHFDRLVV